ncbi:MAG: pyridoxal-phosphate dependent enzyme [Deltaproteobacteria bacterium]|nr:pyridoxal-phosphate dependent enzyme [Deltaproteobacteria bacterium]
MTDFSKRVYDSMLDMLSNADNPTPIVRLNRVVPFKHTKVYAKLEWYNPFGAVKDRVAANLIRDAEEQGIKLQHLVEPTSGNTGIGLSMISNAKGIEFTATLSTAIPAEKRASLRMFGAKLVELSDDLCPMPGQPEGAMSKAEEMSKQPGWHELNQYKNPANPDAHFRTTGPEVWKQTEGKITHFVAGLGTCGTITGTGRFLRTQRKDVKVFGVHPAEGHDIPGVRTLRALKLTDFFLPKEYDGLVEIDNATAYEMARRLNQEESIIAGPSSGMALAGALKLVPDEPGNICVVMFPDNAFKYSGSFKKHLPQLFVGSADDAPKPASSSGPTPEILSAIQDLARESADMVELDAIADLVKGGAALIDVRSPREFAEGHIAEAVNVPVGTLSKAGAPGLPARHDQPLVTICASGKRSLTALLLLKAQGYEKVKAVRGGMNDWEELGRPMKVG